MEGYFINNGEWTLSEFRVEKHQEFWDGYPYPWDEIHILITFTRQSRYYVITVIVPSLALSLVSGVVFSMSPQSEEKVALASSNLLAMLLFQELVSSAMPPIGDEFSLLGLFFVASILVNSLSILTSLLTESLFHKKDKPVPNFLLKITFSNHTWCTRQPTTSKGGLWVVRRLSDMAGGTVSDAIRLCERKYREKSMDIIASDAGSHAARCIKFSIEEDACPITEQSKSDDNHQSQSGVHGKENFSRQWQAVSQRLNSIIAFVLTSSYMLIVIVLVALYINHEDDEFPQKT